MLAFYNRFARRLYRLRVVLWALGAIAVAAFGGVLFLSDGLIDSSYALVSITIVIWTVWLLAVAHSFVEPVAEVDLSARLWSRFKARLRRGLVWAQALTMTVLFILSLVMTMRTTGIVLGGYG